LSDIYGAENQILEVLPNLIVRAMDEELKTNLQNHLEETETHVRRLDEIFALLGEAVSGEACLGMQGILEEGDLSLGSMNNDLTDLAITSSAVKVEHYEIASYRVLIELSQALDLDDSTTLLKDTLGEEEMAAKKMGAAFTGATEELAG